MGHYREILGVRHENLNVDSYQRGDTVVIHIDEIGTLEVGYNSHCGSYCSSIVCTNIPFPVIPAVNFTKTNKQFMGDGVKVAWSPVVY